jgi:hypothetical protein
MLTQYHASQEGNMQTELPKSSPTDLGNRLAARALPPVQRGIVLGMWMGLLLVGMVARWPETLFSHDLEIWNGLWIAQACLLAVWAGLAGRPLPVRLPWALGMTTFATLVNLWVVNRQPYGLSPLILLIPIIFVLLLPPLSLIRRILGWQIAVPEEHRRVAQHSSQFSLRQLLVWMGATAVLLALAKCMLPAGSSFHEDLQKFNPVPIAIVGIATAVVFLPAVLSLLGLVLARADRIKFARWTLVTVSVLTVLVFGSMLAPRSTPWHVAVVHTACLMCGFLGVLLSTLLVLRFCGYRLLRREDDRI